METSDFINPRTVEKAYRNAKIAQEKRNQRFADRGMRAARARDPHLLFVLEKATAVLDKMSEAQTGQTRREVNAVFKNTVEHTELQMWRNAYTICDSGEPTQHYEWIYGAAAELAFGAV